MAALEGALLRFKMFSRFSSFPLVSITVFLRVLVFLLMLYVFNENHFFLGEKKGMLDGAFGKFEFLTYMQWQYHEVVWNMLNVV